MKGSRPVPQGLALLPWLWACSGGAAPAPRPATPPTHPTAALQAPEPAVVQVHTDHLGMSDVPGAGEGTARMQIGGRRAEVDAAGVRFARQAVLGTFVAAVELDDRWVFVATQGPVLTAETFLGDLALVGETGREPHVVTATRGRVAIVAGDALFLTDGRSVVRAGPTTSPPAEAAFLDARTGAATLADGGLAWTRDGGASWQSVTLGADLAFAVRLDGDALRVETTGGPITLGLDGLPRPAPGPYAGGGARPDAAAFRALTEAFEREFGGPGRDDTRESVTLRDGTSVALERSELLRRGPDGAVLARTRMGDVSCAPLERWGADVVVRCAELFRTSDGETLQVVFPPEGRAIHAWSEPGLVFSDDGRHLALPVACSASVGRDDDDHACVLLDGAGRWRELSGVGSYGRLSALHGGLLLYNRCDDGCAATVVDAATGAARPVTLDRAEGDAPMDVGPLAWTPDGALLGFAAPSGVIAWPRWLLLGPPDAPLATRALPDGARAASFADRLRGVAVGEHVRSLWRTLDGGETWQRLEVPVDGPDGAWPRPPRLRCDARVCDVGGVLTVDSWGPERPAERRTLSLLRAAPPPDRRRDRSPLAQLRCPTAGRATPSPWRAPEAPDTTLHTWTAGVARLSAPRRPDADEGDARRRPVSIVWQGEAGPAARAQLLLTPRESPYAFHPYGAGAGLLFDGWGGLSWLAGGVRHPVLAQAPWILRGPEVVDRDSLILPDPAGGVVVLTRRVLNRQVFTVAFQLSARGELGPYRVLGAAAYVVGLARSLGRWGFAVRSADGVLRAVPLAGGEGEPLGPMPPRLAPCAAGAPRDAAVLSLWMGPIADIDLAIADFSPRTGRAEVAVTPSGACLLGVSAWGELRAAQRPVFLRLRAAAGRLAGHQDDLHERQPVRCEVAP